MKALIDNQLPIALAVHLRQCGHDCQHVLEIGLDEADDLTIWLHAQREGWSLSAKMKTSSFLPIDPAMPAA